MKTIEKKQQLVVYDNYSGNPILVTFLGNRWWVVTPGEMLQPLEECFGGDDISFFMLCEAGGTVGALALAKMLGHALENPEDEVCNVMHWRVAAAQSTRGRRSRNSPMPKSSAVRRENTGIAVPAPRKPGWSNIAAWCSRGKGQPFMGHSIQESLKRASIDF